MRSSLTLSVPLLITLCACASARAQNADSLEREFRDPSPESRRLTGPLFWLHGDETPEHLRDYVGIVAEGGNGCFTAESRPHSDWLGPDWWRDLGICLEAAKANDLHMWIFDEKWWPSGEVGGQVPERYGSKHLEASATDVSGPESVALEVDAGRLVAVLAGRVVGGKVDGASLRDLTGRARGGRFAWVAPAGDWRVMVFTWRPELHGGRYLVDGASRDAVEWYIETVYQPHYDHFPQDFGGTIRGFFYDEPETPGDWGSEVIPMLRERGVDWRKALVAWKFELADPEEQVAARYQYQDAFAEAWGRTMYGGISDWCRAHRVRSIGHWLEHGREYLHPRLCAGNMFQVQKYSDMGAIDAVFRQFTPGRKDDNTYQTPKLGSSISHAYGKVDDLAMVEIFGARGQDLTYPEMKWWTDHMHSSGVNFHIPHSFNPRSPHDTDCPPYFYNGGYEPRWPLYRVYADYTSRLSHMLTGGSHVCPVAFLYLGNSYHVGESLTPEDMTTALQDSLFDCDWLPYEVFEGDAVVSGDRLNLRAESYRVLVAPAAEVIPYATLLKTKAFLDAGGVVIGYGVLPERSATLGHTSEDIARLRDAIWGADPEPGVEPCVVRPSGGRSYFLPARPTPEDIQAALTGDAGVHPTLEVLEGDTADWLHVLHRRKDGRDVFFLTNMSWDGKVRDFRMRARADGFPEVWDAMRGEITSLPHTRVGDAVEFDLTLASEESVLLVFSATDRRLPPRLSATYPGAIRPLPGERLPVAPVAAPTPKMPEAAIPLESASWIWHAGDPSSPEPCARWFRGSIELDAPPASAVVSIAADNEYVLYVNGAQVGRGAAWERADQYDVTALLRTGTNVLAIEARNGGQGPNPAGVVASLTVNGESVALATGTGWVSSDAKAEGWEAAEFDDSAWAPVRVLGEYGMAPWGRAGAGVTLSPVDAATPYEGVYQVPAQALRVGWRVFLVAGEITPEQAARVTVNGDYAGGFICQPLRLDVTRHLHPGSNTVRVEPFAPNEVRLMSVPPPGIPLAHRTDAASEDALRAIGYLPSQGPETETSEGEAR